MGGGSWACSRMEGEEKKGTEAHMGGGSLQDATKPGEQTCRILPMAQEGADETAPAATSLVVTAEQRENSTSTFSSLPG